MKIYLSRALFLIVFIGLNFSLFGQDTLQIAMGTIRNSSNYEPISFALVKNEMLHTKIISDENGQYIMPVNKGDLLKITAIGFDDGFYIINEASGIISNFPIQLKPRIYELKEFTLTPYKTVLLFKKAFLELDLPESNLPIALDLPKVKYIRPQTTEGIVEVTLITIKGPFTKLYNKISRRGKMEKKYQLLLAYDDESNVVLKRFTRELVAKIVPLKTNEKLDSFIEFCQFDFSFLLNASDYELVAAIKQKYAQYLQIEARQKQI